jgi:chemotaxis protein methyltransferase CheR
MLVNEFLKPKYPHITFQILASDINTAVIESAKKGIFKEYAVRNIPPNLLNKYFKTNGMSYELSPDIRKMVRFANINLYDERAVKTITGVDVIFCANVLIYFDIPSKQKVVQHLYDVLNPEGYLFIGYSESLHGISKAFSLIHLPKALAYKK